MYEIMNFFIKNSSAQILTTKRKRMFRDTEPTKRDCVTSLKKEF